jgi:DNA-binding response OmpR family regulator
LAGGDGKGRVLLVEDDEAISSLMQTVLREMDLSVDVAPNGPKAIELANKRRPSLVVLDLGLPDMYGKTVAEQLRRLHKKVPVMVVSALAPTAVAEDAWQIGAYTYITKPFELEAFTSAVKRGLRMADGHRQFGRGTD